ncbi:hypothetical protein ACOIDL_28230, partial [Klebsiella pneumoniae]
MARQAQESETAQKAGATAQTAGADSQTQKTHPNEEQTKKTGIRKAEAMVAAESSGAMAAPKSESSKEKRDGQLQAQ